MQKQVSENAVFQRLKRHLKNDGVQLHKATYKNRSGDLGSFYTTDIKTNFVACRGINLEAMAREKKLLLASEIMLEA